jgi:hypothetical protein
MSLLPECCTPPAPSNVIIILHLQLTIVAAPISCRDAVFQPPSSCHRWRREHRSRARNPITTARARCFHLRQITPPPPPPPTHLLLPFLPPSLWLARSSPPVDFTLCCCPEKFAVAQPLGSGLLLQPTGSSLPPPPLPPSPAILTRHRHTGLAVLAHIGADEDILKLGAKVQHLDGRTVDDRIVFDLNYDLLGKRAFGLGVHRASLFKGETNKSSSDCHPSLVHRCPPPPSPAVLFEHATKAGAHIHTSFDVASTIQHPDNTLSIRSMCGASDGPFDLVVDCSGRHSKLVDATPDNIALNEPYPYAALWGVRV